MVNGPVVTELGITEIFKVLVSFHLFNVPLSSPTDPLYDIKHLFSSVGFTGNDQVGLIPPRDMPRPRDHELFQCPPLTYFHDMCSRSSSPGMQKPPSQGQAVICSRGQWPPPGTEGSQTLVVPPGHSSWSLPQPPPSTARSPFHQTENRT